MAGGPLSAPIFRDPVYDGATDPTVLRHARTGEWWLFYTQRRPADPGPGVRWVHGSRIGRATSVDGRHWTYRGTVTGLGEDTQWAPEVVEVDGAYRMYLTVVDGVPSSWDGEAHIVEFRSDDLETWRRIGRIDLGSDRVIDAAVARCADGLWRLWFKDERAGSSTRVAASPDLERWTVEGVAIPAEPPHEGPNVFELAGRFWMITDEWRGLGVHSSIDGVRWARQVEHGGLILDRPGSDAWDREVGHHADVVVVGDVATLVYFTHPMPGDAEVARSRASAIHVARLTVVDGVLEADRDVPADLCLVPVPHPSSETH